MIIEEKEIQHFLVKKGVFFEKETKFNEMIYFLETEFQIGNERIDILGVDGKGTLYVIEIKKSAIDANAIVQCLNYMVGLKRVLSINSENTKPKIKGILVGEDISDNRCKTVISDSNNIDFVAFEKNLKFDSPRYTMIKEYYAELNETANVLLNYIDKYSDDYGQEVEEVNK